MPLRQEALDCTCAITTIQRCWRGFLAVAGLDPPLLARVLRRRAAVRLQRWWRAQLCAERVRMLLSVRARVRATAAWQRQPIYHTRAYIISEQVARYGHYALRYGAVLSRARQRVDSGGITRVTVRTLRYPYPLSR